MAQPFDLFFICALIYNKFFDEKKERTIDLLKHKQNELRIQSIFSTRLNRRTNYFCILNASGEIDFAFPSPSVPPSFFRAELRPGPRIFSPTFEKYHHVGMYFDVLQYCFLYTVTMWNGSLKGHHLNETQKASQLATHFEASWWKHLEAVKDFWPTV